MAERVKRKISAILSADVAGYSKLMEADEEVTVRTVESYRKTVSSLIGQHDGRVIDSPGDNILSEFSSVVDAVQCAVEIQHVIRAKNAVLPEARRMQFRIGINLGDVIEEEGRMYGDGINIASRIEGLADAGGICISRGAYEQIAKKLPLGYEDTGEHSLKNISEPVHVYRIPMDSGNGVVAASTEGTGDKKWRSLTIGLSIAVVLLIGLATGWYLRSQAPSTDVGSLQSPFAPAGKPSIAVLPFSNLSGDPDQEYFADAMTDEIIAGLSKNSMLTVISRNSTFTYKGKAVKVQQVGQELGVKHVLEGSVRKVGNKVRIIAQLVDAATGGHLWSETYERELEDIFAIQAEISQSIAAALRVEYADAEWARVKRIPTDSMTAYDAYWRGRSHLLKFTREDVLEARKYIERAIELDPEYANAYAILSIIHLQSYDFGWETDPEVLRQASNLSKKALSLDSSALDAHTAQSALYMVEGRCELALSEAGRIISIDSNSSWGYNLTALALGCLGRFEEAIANYNKGIRLDPRAQAIHFNISIAYMATGQYAKALDAIRENISLGPDFEANYWVLAGLYATQWLVQYGQDDRFLDSALEIANQCATLDESMGHRVLSFVYLVRKQHDLALAEAEKALADQPEFALGHVLLADVYSYMGKPEKATAVAERAIQLGSSWWHSVLHPFSHGNTYRLLGEPVKAIAEYRKSLNGNPSHRLAYKSRLGLAIVLTELGRIEEAEAEAAEVLKLVPNFSVEVYGQRVPYKDPAQAERDMAALRKAGLR